MIFSLEPIMLMYPYGDAAGDSVLPYDINKRKCFKIVIPDGGMAFFGKRHRKLHVSLSALLVHFLGTINLLECKIKVHLTPKYFFR